MNQVSPRRFWFVLRFSLLIASYCFEQSTGKLESTLSRLQSITTHSTQASPAPAISENASANPVQAARPVPQSEPENPLRQAMELYGKGDFNGAVSIYQSLLRTNHDSAEASAGIARILLKQRNVEEASSTIAGALKSNDAYPLHVALGEILFRQGRIDAAEREWVNVINSGHADARAYLGLSRVRNSLAMYKSSKAMVDKAHKLEPDDPDITGAWAATLSRAERVKYLETMLSGSNNWDADQREGTEIYLKYLKERSKLGGGSCHLVSKVTKTETPLLRMLSDPSHLRGYGLEISLNSHRSRLLLDTGASGIIVKRSIAEHAGIGKIIETKVWGVGDKGKRTRT